jgi:uncharacterized protein
VNLSLPGAKAIRHAIEQEEFCIRNILEDSSLEKSLSILDAGERAAILLAKELDAVLLIDEKRGRMVAHNFALKVKGTAGLLLSGYKRGSITDLKGCLEKLQKSGYRLSNQLIEELLQRAQIH